MTIGPSSARALPPGLAGTPCALPRHSFISTVYTLTVTCRYFPERLVTLAQQMALGGAQPTVINEALKANALEWGLPVTWNYDSTLAPAAQVAAEEGATGQAGAGKAGVAGAQARRVRRAARAGLQCTPTHLRLCTRPCNTSYELPPSYTCDNGGQHPAQRRTTCRWGRRAAGGNPSCACQRRRCRHGKAAGWHR